MGSIVHAVLTSYAASHLQIDPHNPVNDNSGGGVRAAFFGLVRELPRYGQTVRAFSSFTESAVIDGVQYLPLDQLDKHGHPNVMWACYDTRILSGRWGMLRIASHHTYRIEEAPFSHIDVHTVPSQAALDFLKPYWAPWSNWHVLPNAIHGVHNWKPVPGRVVYHTSPERGLHILAEEWGNIRARVPDATLHIIGHHEKWIANTLSQRAAENSEEYRRAKALKIALEKAHQIGGVTCMTNIPRNQVLQELSEASVFAFPCTLLAPCETFSASVMECCKTGVPVVLCPQDALESIYKDHVMMVPAPIEKHRDEFVDSVVRVLQDPALAHQYSELGKELASQYTYARSGKVLSDIICKHTGFVPTVTTLPAPESASVPEYQSFQDTPSAPSVQKSSKKLAFLLDPWGCIKPINPEICFTDSRGLTGSEITCLMQAIEMSKLGHDVTMYSNFTQDKEVHGIKFARWDRWQTEAKNGWYAAFATMQPLGLQHLPPGVLRIFNQQVNDFGYCKGWEQCTDIVTALAHAHQQHLSQFTNFQNWRILPNGCDPAAFHEGKRDNRKLVFASSPDRGLHWLLELFPRLKKRIPDVECHIYYNFQDNAVQIYTQLNEHEMANRFKYINLALAKLKGHGVFHHKNVSRQEIAQVFSESRILAYTCDPVRFTEGFSCTTLEGAVSGCLPVICGSDALGEIYGNFVPTTPAPYAQNRDHYFDNLMKYLIDNDAYKQAQTKAKEMAKTHNWTAVAKQLQAILGLA